MAIDDKKTKLSHKIFGAPPSKVAKAHKELRFTRARQATHIFLAAAFFAILGMGTFVAMFASWGPTDPDFLKWFWLCILPLIPALLLSRLALHCVRHAYLLLTPMGIEIFPLLKPEKNLQVLFWSEIDNCEFKGSTLLIHRNKEKTSGSIITLKPLHPQQITLLQKAITARTNGN